MLSSRSNIATLLDRSGALVTLPYDLTVAFARYVARQGVASMRRFDISRVFRADRTGGQPQAVRFSPCADTD
jgi:translation initiation factor 2-alpha kinase 4